MSSGEEQSRVADTFGALNGIRSVVANDDDRPAWSERTDCPPQHAPALLDRKVEEQAEYEVEPRASGRNSAKSAANQVINSATPSSSAQA